MLHVMVTAFAYSGLVIFNLTRFFDHFSIIELLTTLYVVFYFSLSLLILFKQKEIV